MDRIFAIISSFTTTNWIAIVAIVVGIILWIAKTLFDEYKEHKKTRELRPEVRAIINRTRYDNGWRSVQLHIMPAADQEKFQYEKWRIESMRFLYPGNAVLARAKDDDYASGVFFPEASIRSLEGKVEGKPQRFALEFFIKFKGDDHGQKAKFKVAFSHIVKKRRFTTKVWATVPSNAE